MPDEKISNLPAAAALTGVELIPIVQGGQTVQTTMNAVVAYFVSTAHLETHSITGTTQALAHVPTFIIGVFMNGQYLTYMTDYTISGNTINFVNTLAADSVTFIYNF